MNLPAIPNQFADAVEAHCKAHPAQQSTAHRQNYNDMLGSDVKLKFIRVLQSKQKHYKRNAKTQRSVSGRNVFLYRYSK